jgi:hypothetical protein
MQAVPASRAVSSAPKVTIRPLACHPFRSPVLPYTPLYLPRSNLGRHVQFTGEFYLRGMEAALVIAAMAGLPAVVILLVMFAAERRAAQSSRKTSPLRYAPRRRFSR